MRRGRAALFDHQQESQHLDRLAKPHVVGQTRSQPEVGNKPQPAHAQLLIMPQRGVQRLARMDLCRRLWIGELSEDLRQPFARDDARPTGRFDFQERIARPGKIRPGQKAHAFNK